MTYLPLIIVLAVLAVPAAYLAGSLRRGRGAAENGLTPESVAFLRKLDKMILSNLSFDYLATQFADLLPSANRFLGGTLRTVDDDGRLRVLATTDRLAQADDPLSLHGLADSVLSPEQMQRSASQLTQAVNQRQAVAADDLAKLTPELEAGAAAKVQAHLGIKSLYAYPVIVEERVRGAITFYFDRSAAGVTPEEKEVMQSISDELAIAIENARLINQLGDMNRQLAEANTHLQEMDATKDEFISIASHQLRSPLTAVKGYLSMLQEGDYGKLSQPQRQVLTQLSLSTNELINLISDMLSVSRINAQKFELSRVPVKLEEIVATVVQELRPLAAKKNLDLRVELPDRPLGELRLDPMRIRQVIINFIDNGIKYTERGSVTVRLTETDGTLRFTVSDTGIGIPEDEQDKMFAKFYRAANARSVVAAGSGLGLFVAKRIIEDHGGQCLMESTEGTGSTFGFTMPLPALQPSRPGEPAAV